MFQPISRPMLGLTDYNYITNVSTAPTLVGFKDEKKAVLLCRALSGGILVSSIFTRAEWGFIRVMPYKAHLAIDALGGLTALSAPWLFGFSQNARAQHVSRSAIIHVMGVFGLLAGTLSRPEEMD